MPGDGQTLLTPGYSRFSGTLRVPYPRGQHGSMQGSETLEMGIPRAVAGSEDQVFVRHATAPRTTPLSGRQSSVQNNRSLAGSGICHHAGNGPGPAAKRPSLELR